MRIEKLFYNLSVNKELIFYLFEHRDKTVLLDEIEKFISFEKLEVLESFELIERVEQKLFLDGRVIEFLEKYLDIDENIEVSIIHEKLNNLKHKTNIVLEYKNKQNELLPQVRRELKKCDFIIIQNLFKLRIHIDRVYKNIEQFSLKLIELKFYENKLQELSIALQEFEKFIALFRPKLAIFYNSELNSVIDTIKQNNHEINKSLIPLTQDVCEYINKATQKNIFIEKITKLKELKDSFLIKEQTDILDKIENYEPLQTTISIKTKLNQEILRAEQFITLLEKSKNKLQLKSKKANSIKHYDEQIEHNFLDIYSIHLNFKFSKQNLMEFLMGINELKQKEFEEILQVYCKLILLYEQEYKIEEESMNIAGIQFKKVYYDK